MSGLDFRQRIGLLVIGMACVFLLLAGRLFEITVIEHDQWLAAAETPNSGWAPLVARRGRILDRDGRVLAGDDVAYDLVMYASGWRGRLHQCDYCAFRRFVRPDHRIPNCPRCKARPYEATKGRKKRGLRYADQRELRRIADALKMRRQELLDQCLSEFQAVESTVAKRADKETPSRRREARRNAWADLGWRPRVIARGVPYEVARLVELYPRRYPAFGILTVNARQCWSGPAFAHLVGHAKREGERANHPGGGSQWVTRARGANGVERLFDRELTGVIGWKQMRRQPGTRQKIEADRQAPLHGLDVHLTIRESDQRVAHESLDGVQGALVVVNATTGAVLAMASTPSYEPRQYHSVLVHWVKRQQRAEKARKRGDPIPLRVVGRQTPLVDRSCALTIPGSIIKPFTAIAGLRAELLTPDRIIECDKVFHNTRGQVIRGRMTCHARHGAIDLHRSLTGSCNIYYQTILREFIASRHDEDFLDVGRMFGFGEPTGLPLEHTKRVARGWSFDRAAWAQKIMSSIGQGLVLLSPAQIARAYAGLATGRLPQVHVVSQVGPRATEPKGQTIPIPAPILATVRRALFDVPRIGTAKGHGLDAFGVACKTGTAQLQSKAQGKRYNSWIAGFAGPRDGRPAIAFAIVVRDTNLQGADACGRRLRDFLTRFYRAEE